ncbi:MAG: 4Fe-4S binding protein [Veillonella sp.]|nr:4Fe-4S binding protein [Veillonella sp.]
MGNLKFDIDDTCVKCGACAEDCPVQCITEGTTKFIIGSGCISCGDCYSICPVGAVQMHKLFKIEQACSNLKWVCTISLL